MHSFAAHADFVARQVELEIAAAENVAPRAIELAPPKQRPYPAHELPPSAECLHCLLRDREPEARPAGRGICAIEASENMLELVRGDPDTGIGDLDRHARAADKLRLQRDPPVSRVACRVRRDVSE